MMTKKQIWVTVFCILAMLAFSSCNSVDSLSPAEKQAAQEAAQRKEKMNLIRTRLDKIHTYIDEGKLDQAEAYLAPL